MAVLRGADVIVLGIMLVRKACGMTALHKDDVFVLGIIGAPSGKLSLCLESSMGGLMSLTLV